MCVECFVFLGRGRIGEEELLSLSFWFWPAAASKQDCHAELVNLELAGEGSVYSRFLDLEAITFGLFDVYNVRELLGPCV